MTLVGRFEGAACHLGKLRIHLDFGCGTSHCFVPLL
jgi:hypothetical protein